MSGVTTATRKVDVRAERPQPVDTGSGSKRGPASAVRRRWMGGRAPAIALGAAAALAGTALIVNWQAHRAERHHPPVGKFIDVNGVRLHYLEAGDGPPVVLLHGNGSMLNDPALSILHPLSERHRVIAFDRPGFGFSDRPKDTVWTPDAQATLLRDAFRALGLDRPVLYGHSFGAPVVITFALNHPEDTRGVVAASGYYYPTRRVDSAIAWMNGLPVLGPLMRNTLTPIEGVLFGKLAVRMLFDPQPIPDTYRDFPAALALRPSQIRAAAEDGQTLRDWAERTMRRYREIRLPVIILSGLADRIVDPQVHSLRLHRQIATSQIRLLPETGHMIHHSRPRDVVAAIREVFRLADERLPAPRA
jgi:pimeloyl-ACP methyl ester carboxylesterase